MRCEDLIGILSRREEGALSASERKSLDAHVASCTRCAAETSRERALSSTLERWGSSIAVGLGPAPVGAAPRPASPRWALWGLPALGVLAVGAALLLDRPETRGGSPTSPESHAAPSVPSPEPQVPPEPPPPSPDLPPPTPPAEPPDPPPQEPPAPAAPTPSLTHPHPAPTPVPPVPAPAPPSVTAPGARPSGVVSHQQAYADLRVLEEHLRDRRIDDDILLEDLDRVAIAARTLDEKVDRRQAEAFRESAATALLAAVVLVETGAGGIHNLRDGVNVRAAVLLGEVLAHGISDARVRKRMARRVQSLLEKELRRRTSKVPVELTEAVFAALGKLNDLTSLEWLTDRYVHTRNVPEDEQELVAAHKAMILFRDVPGKQRYAVVDAFLKIYPSTEALAERSSNDAKAQSAKLFWDRVKTDAIAVVRYYALSPTNEKGEALSTMAEFAEWFRDHDRLKQPPWTDPKLPK